MAGLGEGRQDEGGPGKARPHLVARFMYQLCKAVAGLLASPSLDESKGDG